MYLIFCYLSNSNDETLTARFDKPLLDMLAGWDKGLTGAEGEEIQWGLSDSVVSRCGTDVMEELLEYGGSDDYLSIVKENEETKAIWERVRGENVRRANTALCANRDGVFWRDIEEDLCTGSISWDAIYEMAEKQKEPVSYTITAELNAEEGIYVHVTIPGNDDQVSFILQIGDLHKLVSADEARAFIELLSSSDYVVEDGPVNLSHPTGPN